MAELRLDDAGDGADGSRSIKLGATIRGVGANLLDVRVADTVEQCGNRRGRPEQDDRHVEQASVVAMSMHRNDKDARRAERLANSSSSTALSPLLSTNRNAP